ncbi:hypothetical protein EJ110_NYTH17583 [Nymphaea thermarum]|nr:hypothetical protein EJ110_NYTH17583 [Nymphaea thermarum]
MATLTGYHINSSTLRLPPVKCCRKGVNLSLHAGRLRIASSFAMSSSRNGLALLTRKGERTRRGSAFVVRCQAPTDGRITQQEFTEMAWQAIVSSPEVAKASKQQIVETEHLMKALLEQKNGLARRIFSKAGVDNTRLLEATERFIQRQPKVIGETAGSMLGRDLEALFQRAREYKKEYGDSFVSVEHLVLGYVQDQRFGRQLFKDFQISLKSLTSAIQSIRGKQTILKENMKPWKNMERT